MKNYYNVLKNNALFENISETNMDSMLKCLQVTISDFKKGNIIVSNGSFISNIGLVLFGSVQIIKEDFNGNYNIVAKLSEGELFGETFVCSGITVAPVTVMAASNCKILFLNYNKIILTCPSACTFHTKLIENMIKILANKNLQLNKKIDLLSKRSIREKLVAYFKYEVEKTKSTKFTINFSRQELADFLCVDRSAMSRELSKMQNDKLIKFKSNNFEVLSL